MPESSKGTTPAPASCFGPMENAFFQGVVAKDDAIWRSPHRFVMTTSRYSLGTTIVPSPALSIRARRA